MLFSSRARRAVVLLFALVSAFASSTKGQDEPQPDCDIAKCVVVGPSGFSLDSRVWANTYTGDQVSGIELVAVSTLGARSFPATLYYSFAPDGTSWGGFGNPSGTSTLQQELENRFLIGNADLGRELIRQALSARESISGLRYIESADDGASISDSPVRAFGPGPNPVILRGDIRIGGFDGATPSAFGQALFPPFGGDMILDTATLSSSASGNNLGYAANSFRFLRNVVSHENGHGLGFWHTSPGNDESKIMESRVPRRGVDCLGLDDLRGTQEVYGDRYAPLFNHEATRAVDFGSLAQGALDARSVVERHLSLHAGTLPTAFQSPDEDWFRFELGREAAVRIVANPTGTQYLSSAAGDDDVRGIDDDLDRRFAEKSLVLRLELYRFVNGVLTRWDQGPTGPTPPPPTPGPGVTQLIDYHQPSSLPSGVYFIRVVVASAGDTSGQNLQLYDLEVRVDNAFAAPRAFAGIPKRIRLTENCFFIGDLNSYSNEAGTKIVRFDWDLNGNWNGQPATFDSVADASVARPVFVYRAVDFPGQTAPFDVPVTLRVKDSNGLYDFHTIIVTVLPTP